MYIIFELSAAAHDTIPLIKEGGGQKHTPKGPQRERSDNRLFIDSVQSHKNQQKPNFEEDIISMEGFREAFKSSNISKIKDSQSFQIFSIST